MAESAKKTSASKKSEPSMVKDMFKAGVQFGHETRRWNPKMKKYIYDVRNNIHIIDIAKSEELLKKAYDFLKDAASRGEVVLVGTKKQASQIVKELAVDSGAHFVNVRWAGGLLTNFNKVKESFAKLRSLETQFEQGVEGRTKYEVSLMKKEWQKLGRLYSGMKMLQAKPTAMVVIDINYEKGAINEAKKLGIPVIGIVDTNSDPEEVDYPIPANDDAISSIQLIIGNLAEAIKEGNKNNGVKHFLKDYSKVEVQVIKPVEETDEAVEEIAGSDDLPKITARVSRAAKKSTKATRGKTKGILERVQEQKEQTKSKK